MVTSKSYLCENSGASSVYFFGSVLIFVFFFLIKKLHYNDFSAPEGLYSSEGGKNKDYWF